MTKTDNSPARELFEAGNDHGRALERYISAVISGDSAAIARESDEMNNARKRFRTIVEEAMQVTP